MAWQGEGPPVVGVDLGGTKILAGVVGAENRILGRGKRNTPASEGGPAIFQTMTECVDEALDSAGVTRDEIAAGGIGSPGPLDAKAGVILFSPNLNVKNFPIGPELAGYLNRPVMVQNDVRVAGYAEFRLGAGRGYRDLIAAFVGTGIGGCIILGGEIVTGSTGNAGEIGHTIVKANGPRCGCGALGCMEALASKTAIQRRVNKAIQKGIPTVLRDKMARKGGRLKSRDLAESVAAKDPVALKSVERLDAHRSSNTDHYRPRRPYQDRARRTRRRCRHPGSGPAGSRTLHPLMRSPCGHRLVRSPAKRPAIRPNRSPRSGV